MEERGLAGRITSFTLLGKVVELLQHIFETGCMPTDLPWSVLVAIPKGSGGFRGIGLLEIIWKLLSSTIDFRMKGAIQVHPAMHGFRTGQGTGTASIKLKLHIQLATIHQIPLHIIFLDLKKAYDSIHSG